MGFATFQGNTAPVYILGSVFVLQTVTELCLSPVGLSATTRLAPKAVDPHEDGDRRTEQRGGCSNALS